MKYALAAAILALAACSQPAQHAAPEAISPVTTEAPSGAYTLDPLHANVLFRVNHLGMVNYTTNFTGVSANLNLDTAQPERSSVEATVDVASLELDNEVPGFRDIMIGENMFDAARHPQMTFRSTSIELTSPNTARINGDFTLKGVTRPIVLEATFNNGYAGHQLDPNARIGFSATTRIKRSEFNMGFGVPPDGSTMGVSDDVEIILELEFSGPAWTNPSASASTQQ